MIFWGVGEGRGRLQERLVKPIVTDPDVVRQGVSGSMTDED